MSDISNTPGLILVNLGTRSSADVVPVFKLPRRFCITAVKLLNAAVIAADNATYAVLLLKNGSTTLATLDTRSAGQGAIADNVPKSFVLTAAAATAGHREVTLEVAADVVLTLDVAFTVVADDPETEEVDESTTITLTAAQLQIEGYWR